jgi:hypothetical protein
MVLFIPLVFVAFSLRVLFDVKNGRIVKNPRFLKYINEIHLIAACIYFLFLLLVIPMFGGRGEIIATFFIYALFGVTTLISNIVVLLINRYTKVEDEPGGGMGA